MKKSIVWTFFVVLSGLLLLAGCTTDEGITVVTYGGGAYQQSHKEAFLTPFSEARDVETRSVVWGAEYGRLQQMVKSGSVSWDVVEVTAAQYARGVSEGLFEPLGFSLPDSTFRPIAGGPRPGKYGVPNIYWSTVLAYDPDDFEESPSSWKDFWNIKSFPGPRALYDSPRANLEFALLSKGVPRDSLYPLDVNRAFRRLTEVKPEIRVWWQDGTEPIRLLLNDQVTMSTAWTGRIFASEEARQELDFLWRNAAHELDYWVIPKGADDVEAAREFIRFASRPQRMAEQASLTAYGPANANAVKLVADTLRRFLPTAPANWEKSFVVNSQWWMGNEDKVQQRWMKWKN